MGPGPDLSLNRLQSASQHEEHDACCTMRHFLDGKIRWSWNKIIEAFDGGQDFGSLTKDGLGCDITVSSGLRAIVREPWMERSLVYSKSRPKRQPKTWVYQARLNLRFAQATGLHSPFAIKRLPPNTDKKEIEVMKDLRHPHIAFLLATYTQNEDIHILSYPSGCCDLGEFMHCISESLHDRPWREPVPKGSTTQTVKDGDAPYLWPFKAKLSEQLGYLRKFMVCICRAVEYLHMVGVRHRDIKPENMIIDIFGNVVLTDFDCSKIYETEELASKGPMVGYTETYKAPDEDLRNRKSDVWSLGCVFVEIVTLLRGQPLDKLRSLYKQRRLVRYNEDPSLMVEWLQGCRTTGPDTTSESCNLNTCSVAIEKMLALDIDKRLNSEDLYKFFDFPDQPACRDCHPSSPSEWIKNVPEAEKSLWQTQRRKADEQEQKHRATSSIRILLGGDLLSSQPLIARQIGVMTGAQNGATNLTPVRNAPNLPSVDETIAQASTLGPSMRTALSSMDWARRDSNSSEPALRDIISANIRPSRSSASIAGVILPTRRHESPFRDDNRPAENIENIDIVANGQLHGAQFEQGAESGILDAISESVNRLKRRNSVTPFEKIPETTKIALFDADTPKKWSRLERRQLGDFLNGEPCGTCILHFEDTGAKRYEIQADEKTLMVIDLAPQKKTKYHVATKSDGIFVLLRRQTAGNYRIRDVEKSKFIPLKETLRYDEQKTNV